jgi:ABC-type lipoprotein release transport system permease subunit
VPGSSLFGRRSDLGRSLRLKSAGVLTPGQLGDFSLDAHQQAVRAVFVPLATLQRTLGQPGQINTLLFDAREEETTGDSLARAAAIVRRVYHLEDVGLRVRVLQEQIALSLESDSAMLDDATVAAAHAAAAATALDTRDVLTYLATAIRSGSREIPYSLVTALGKNALADLPGLGGNATMQDPSIVLNRWAADDLGVGIGATIELEYLLWEEEGRFRTERATFTVSDVIPLEGAAADRDLAPEYPGVTESQSLADWDPPFPVDLTRVRERDEAYWDVHRATPKAFVTLPRGQQLWRHRLGRLTSIRLVPTHEAALEAARIAFVEEMRGQLDPFTSTFSIEAVRAQGLTASRGATDFGEYFGYFSFFLIVAALLLAALFFRLGAEQRLAELGLLIAVGFRAARVRSLFLREGVVLAALGSGLGVLGAWGYAALMMWGLRTIWVDAVGTGGLQLHISTITLALGAFGGLLSAVACIAWSLRSLLRIEPRRLLAGSLGEPLSPTASRSSRLTIVGSLVGAAALLAMATAGVIPAVGGFFGAGGALMLAALVSQWRALAARATSSVSTVAELGFRSASYRPGRSLLCIALIAFATFVIVSVGAFRHEGTTTSFAHDSSNGGYTLFADSLLPIHHDPNTPAGREALGLDALDSELWSSVHLAPFRVRPGDDASCLNLYRPQDPRILAPRGDFLEAKRFAFGSTLAETPAEEENPWQLLERELEDGVIPVIGDQSSLAYVLHVGLGEEFTLERPEGAALRLRVVGVLRTGLFQGELLMAERQFLRAFPEQSGYRFFLIDGPSDRAPEIAAQLESRLEDYGFDAQTTASRLEEFQKVENTYLATFQTLGALGLLLGTVGLATVLLRNALERRRELALLRAVGYRRGHMALLVLAENVLLLTRGLATGTGCALVAIAPAAFERGASFPYTSLGMLLLVVLATGISVSWIATRAITHEPLLPALRSE